MSNVIQEINDKIRKEIQAYADAKGITYAEAAAKAQIRVGDVELKPISSEFLRFDNNGMGIPLGVFKTEPDSTLVEAAPISLEKQKDE